MWLAVIALAVFAGWRAWNWYHDGQAQDAAREYAGLVSAADSGKIEQVRERYDAIQKGYGSSVYAGMAGLRAAEGSTSLHTSRILIRVIMLEKLLFSELGIIGRL